MSLGGGAFVFEPLYLSQKTKSKERPVWLEQRAGKVAGSEPTEGSSSGTMSSPHPVPHIAHISFQPQSLGLIGWSSPSYFPLYTDIFL